MAKVNDTLAPNQLAALNRPCRKCHASGTVRERRGRFGPWVQCDNCGDKVHRPRGWTVSNNTPRVNVPVASPAPVVSAPATSLDVEQVATLVEPRVWVGVSAKVSEALSVFKTRIETLVREKLPPRVMELTRNGVTIATVTGQHYLFPRLARLVANKFHVYMYGPAGSGKTTAALYVADMLGMGAEIDTMDPTTFRSMIQGHCTPTGEPVHTHFTRCVTDGRVYVNDETDNSPGHVQTLFNSALANGRVPLAWGNATLPETFRFIGTGNTPGFPTREFPDRKPMSAAFRDRLYFLYWPIDPAIECNRVGLPCPVPPEPDTHTCEPAQWVSWVRKVREWCRVNAPTLMVTPRASLDGLRALAIGESPREIADGLVFRGADSELVSKVLNAVPLP